MKVMHVTTVDSTLHFMLAPQLRAVIEAGGEVVGVSSPGPWVARIVEGGIRHVALTSSTRSMSLSSDFRTVREFWRVLRTERPDILHTHNPKPGLYGRVLGRVAGVPVVINTVHGLYATERDSMAKRALVYGLEGVASRFSDLELVQSAEDLRLMTTWRISRPPRTSFLGNGIDVRRFDPDRFPVGFGAAKRAELGISDEVVVVGIVARLVAEKGYPELLAAMERLGPRYSLLAVGPEDPQKDDSLDAQSMARAGVLFLGHRDDVDELFTAMDIFVLPSHREGFPRAAMEAASSGLPIVATNVRGCREVVENEINGLLVPVLDSEALATAIARLGDDRGLRSSMGRAGRAKALEEFDEKQVISKVIAAYRRAARHKGLAIWPRSGPCGEVTIREEMPSDRRLLHRLLAKAGSRASHNEQTMSIVAEDRAGLAGVACAVAAGDEEARLVGVFVTPDARGGGVGRLLLRSLLDRLTDDGVTEVAAEPVDPPTGALLRSAGFTADANGKLVSRLGASQA